MIDTSILGLKVYELDLMTTEERQAAFERLMHQAADLLFEVHKAFISSPRVREVAQEVAYLAKTATVR